MMFTLVSLVNILYFSLVIFDFFFKSFFKNVVMGPSERALMLIIISIIVDLPLHLVSSLVQYSLGKKFVIVILGTVVLAVS